MTPYEMMRIIAQPILPVLGVKARREIKRLLEQLPEPRRVLDVGGRRSPYTIGLPAQITVLDIPRENEVQAALNLGFTDNILKQLKSTRSNIHEVVIQDMTKCTLPSDSYDAVTCVEVIEHVPEDSLFVQQIARVLKPGGFAYFTTPNGDYIRNEPPNYNPDHIRHYTRQGLHDLLCQYFDEVKVTYGVKVGKNRYRGLKSIQRRYPMRSLKAIWGNLMNHLESRGLDEQPKRTANLFAVARKLR